MQDDDKKDDYATTIHNCYCDFSQSNDCNCSQCLARALRYPVSEIKISFVSGMEELRQTTTYRPSNVRLSKHMVQLHKALNIITTTTSNSIVSEVARCLRCMKPMLLAIRATLVSGNHFERFVNVCDRIRGMLRCTSHVPGKCSRETGIESLLASFQHFCEDRFSDRDYFLIVVYKHTFECLDLHSAQTLTECQKKCQANRQIVGWFLYSYIRSTLPFTLPEPDVPAKINVQYFNKISSDICGPLISLHKSWPYSPIANSMMLIMPQTCDFITTLEALNHNRLDGKTEAKIDNAFSKGVKSQYFNLFQSYNLSTISPFPLLKAVPSPLDLNEFSSNLGGSSGPSELTKKLPSIHVEEVQRAIEEFEEIDLLQRLKAS
uniref:Chondroitin proteoglycan 4 domain-containing protein n=1 Tax=Setaria digitata TaxID=48799 RepID=A0A915PQF7_9BILA